MTRARTISSGSPVGSVISFAGASAPTDWLLCDGATVSRTEYASLFSIIGTTYGVGNGSTTFNLPNLKGRTVVGVDAAQTEFDALGETGGAKTHTLTVDQMPSHQHNTGGSPGIYRNYIGSGSSHAFLGANTSTTVSDPYNTSFTGGGQAHNNLQPYIVMNYIIKVA